MQYSGLEDRRIFERIPLDSSAYFFCTKTKRWGSVRLKDMSAKGVGFLANEALEPGCTLEMWLSLPERDGFFYTCGDVVWSGPADPDKRFVGVELRKAELAGMAQVLRTVKQVAHSRSS